MGETATTEPARTHSPLENIRIGTHHLLRLAPDDLLLIDFIVAAALSVCLGGQAEPVWGYVVGPAASGKTESLMSLTGWSDETVNCEMTKVVSDLTVNSLMSANPINGEECSLLLELENRVLIFPDFTGMLSKDHRTRQEILGQLRQAFDGDYVKRSGTKGAQRAKVRFGMLAGVTPKIEDVWKDNQQLGERALIFRMGRVPKLDWRASLRHTLESAVDKDAWKTYLKEFVGGNLAAAQKLMRARDGARPSRPDWCMEHLENLTKLVVDFRNQPLSDGTAIRTEDFNRVGQQLLNLGDSHALVDARTEWDQSDCDLLTRVAEDTLPLVLKRAVVGLRGETDEFTEVATWASRAAISTSAARKILRQWEELGVAESKTTRGAEGSLLLVRLSGEVRALMRATRMLTRPAAETQSATSGESVAGDPASRTPSSAGTGRTTRTVSVGNAESTIPT